MQTSRNGNWMHNESNMALCEKSTYTRGYLHTQNGKLKLVVHDLSILAL
jgi:hypothetical protein